MEALPFPILEELANNCALQANRNHGGDKAGKLHYVDVSSGHFVGNFTHDGWRGTEVTSDRDRVNGRIGLASGVKAKLILHRTTDPWDFHLTGWLPGDELFLAGRRE